MRDLPEVGTTLSEVSGCAVGPPPPAVAPRKGLAHLMCVSRCQPAGLKSCRRFPSHRSIMAITIN